MDAPKKMEITKLMEQVELPLDVFICSTSFEKRCTIIPRQIENDNVKHVIIFENKGYEDLAKQNRKILQRQFGEKGSLVDLRRDDPVASADSINEALQEAVSQDAKRFLIDITTFTHEGLLILLGLLRRVLTHGESVQFAYNSAKDYAVGMENEDKWLSKGVKDVRSVLGYLGVLSPARKSHLIVIAGYEVERAAILIDMSEPSQLSLGRGGSEASIDSYLHGLNVRFCEELTHKYKSVNNFELSLIDPVKTKQALEKQVGKFPDHNVVIAAMNTKISTVGAAITAMANNKIQICYASASIYNHERYSSPSNNCYLFKVPGLLETL